MKFSEVFCMAIRFCYATNHQKGCSETKEFASN